MSARLFYSIQKSWIFLLFLYKFLKMYSSYESFVHLVWICSPTLTCLFILPNGVFCWTQIILDFNTVQNGFFSLGLFKRLFFQGHEAFSCIPSRNCVVFFSLIKSDTSGADMCAMSLRDLRCPFFLCLSVDLDILYPTHMECYLYLSLLSPSDRQASLPM